MNASESKNKICQICGNKNIKQLRPAITVRPAISDLIKEETGSWNGTGWICDEHLQQYRQKYIQSILEKDKGELTNLEKEVLESIEQNEIVSKNLEPELDSNLTLGQRLADKIADFGGSWTFIVLFFTALLLWMLINTYLLYKKPFDPYPFILLNLVLSCLAAIQAPIIMMSQNRQESRDRKRALHDYQVNLKAELEIRQLHQKLDHLITNQWERLLEIQEIQIDLMNEIKKPRDNTVKK